MKVVFAKAPNELSIEEIDVPHMGPCDVLIKVVSAGICGTDLFFYDAGPRFEGIPMPLGHEYSGEIVEASKQVSAFKIGDRMAYNSNNSPADMGRGGECGGFSQYVVLLDVDDHAQSLCKLPPNVSYDHAALIEPLSVGAHVVNRAAPNPGESVALFGAGPIGLGVIMVLVERGFDDIVVFEPSPLRRELALNAGAKAAFDPGESSPSQVLTDLRGATDIWGFPHANTDIFIEASGAPGLLADIIDFCGKGCRVITLAVHRERVSLDATKIISKEISLIGSQGYPKEFPQVLEKIAKYELDPEQMVSHRFSFEQFEEAFSVACNSVTAAKVLLQFNSSAGKPVSRSARGSSVGR